MDLVFETVKAKAGVDSHNYRLMAGHNGVRICVFSVHRNPHVTIFKAPGFQATVKDKAHLEGLIEDFAGLELIEERMRMAL